MHHLVEGASELCDNLPSDHLQLLWDGLGDLDLMDVHTAVVLLFNHIGEWLRLGVLTTAVPELGQTLSGVSKNFIGAMKEVGHLYPSIYQ